MRQKFIIIYIILLVLFIGGFSGVLIKNKIDKENEIPFVKVNGNKGFRIKDKPFCFIGANTVYLVFYDDLNLDLERAIKEAKKNGISVIRLYMDWGGWAKMKDYDRILDLASKHSIYVILTLTDCAVSADYPSLRKYFGERPFCNIRKKENIKRYKKRIREILLRKNSINGKIYKDDSTIFAWDIANELEYWHFKKYKFKKWIKEISSYIKSIDSNHLVTIGVSVDSDDFDNNNSMYEIFNVPELDFFSLHFYPVHRDWDGDIISDKYKERLASRIRKFLSMEKPVILEEFGFSSSGKLNQKIRFNNDTQNLYYDIFSNTIDSAFSSGASGVMFWGWGVPEAKDVSMWWAPEIHDYTEEEFVELIKKYKIPCCNCN